MILAASRRVAALGIILPNEGKFLEYGKFFLDRANFTFYGDLARYPGIHIGIAACSTNDAI
jgi:hypothetical protein